MSEHNLMTTSQAPDHTVHAPTEGGAAPPPRRFRYLRKHKRTRAVLAILAVVFLTLAVVSIIGATRLYNGVQQTQAAVAQAEKAAADFDFPAARRALNDAQSGLETAKSGLGYLRWTYPIPWVGDQVEAVDAVVTAGLQSVLALSEVIDLAEDIYDIVLEAEEILAATELGDEEMTFNDFSPEVKADILRTLHNAHPDLQEMQVKLVLAQQNLDKLDDLNASPAITDAVALFRELLPDLIAGVDFLVPFAATVGDLAGVDADRQWLMLFLNNQEMRPGGGFIGVYGLLLARDGEIVNMSVDDSYAVDVFVQFDDTYQVSPPAPLQEFVGVSKWFFRDANWSPDFPQSSRDAMQLLRQEVAHTGQPAPELHGVIGFTPTFASSILELTGPITVRGETFTSENLAQRLEELVEFDFEDIGASYEERKAIVGELTEAVMHELFSLPVSRWDDLFALVSEEFTTKQIALYSTFEDTQSAFVDAGWAGEVDIANVDDVLMVVDANMAALKTDPVVERQITYSLYPDGDDFIATASVEYTNTGTFTDFTTRYRTYTRVYVPLGSELLDSSGSLRNDKLSNPSLVEDDVTVVDELGMTSFGAFTSIEPGESRTLSFTYRLPESVEEAIHGRLYQLKVLKQIGADNHGLTVDLDFDKTVKAATPAEDASQFGDNGYHVETSLEGDTVFTVQF